MNTAVAPQYEQENIPAIVPMDLMQRAITSGADIIVLEKLMALQERWEANQARKAFDAAMAAASEKMPPILKNRLVDFRSAKGHTRYRYEDYAEIISTVRPILGEHGLSIRFRTSNDDHKVTVTCIVAHRDGHSEENTLSGRHDPSGNKNDIQAVGSATTYLQRYTLKAALGLASADEDDDAQSTTQAGNRRPDPPRPEITIDKDAKPFELQLATDINSAAAWSVWAATLMGYVRVAPTADLINEWITANADTLARLNQYDAGKYERLVAMINHQIAARGEHDAG